MLRKLCLPFSPYRQRPDITLHGHGASRTEIPAQGPSRTLAEVRRICRPESGPVSYQITIRDRDLRRAAVVTTLSKRLCRPPRSTGRTGQPSRLRRYCGRESAIRVGFGHDSSDMPHGRLRWRTSLHRAETGQIFAVFFRRNEYASILDCAAVMRLPATCPHGLLWPVHSDVDTGRCPIERKCAHVKRQPLGERYAQ